MNPLKNPSSSRRRKIFLLSGIAVILSAALIAGIFIFRQYDSQRSEQLADGFRDPLSYMSSVDQITWDWQPPRQLAMREIQPTASGLIVIHAEGMVAIDGVSGDEIWDQEFPQDSSAAVTPDGLKVVHTLPSGNGGSKELTVLNSATGRQLSKLDVPGDAFAHRQLLTSTHVIAMNDGEIEAFSLESGDRSWTYQAPPECLELPNFDPENVWQWPVSTHEDLVFVPQVCFGSSDQEPETNPDAASLNVVALESATGENFWDSEVIFSTEYADDTGDGSYPSRLMSSGDMQTLILRAPEGFYALDAEGGEVLSGEEPMAIEDGLFEDRLLYAGSEFFVFYDPELSNGDEIVYAKSTYGGETVEEIRVPEDIHPPVDPPWTPAPRAAALGEGIVLFSCGGGNDCEEGSVPLEIYFFPWDGGEPSEVRFQGDTPELSGPYLRSSLLPVPGAVVAYQRWPAGYPVGAVVGLT